MSLDIGCGASANNIFLAKSAYGIDIIGNKEKNIISADLNVDKIPFADGSFDYVTAFDFIEHIPRVAVGEKTRFPFVQLMNEVARVLAVDGLFFSKTPAYPTKEAFQDPTHCNIITEDTFKMYFCGAYPIARMYGFEGRFELISQEWLSSWLLTLMRRVD